MIMILTLCCANTGLKMTIIKCDMTGERLDVFLGSSLNGLTRSAAQRLLEAGRVTLLGIGSVERVGEAGDEADAPCCGVSDSRSGEGGALRGGEGGASCGVVVRKSHRTSAGEIFCVEIDDPEPAAAVAQDIPLDIVYEDEDVIVVNKPRGMVVHPAPGHPDGTLVNALLHHCEGSLSGIGGIKRPGIVHRLDKDTSGLVIAAKNDRAHRDLARQLAERTIYREYAAIVHGVVKPDGGVVDEPIGRHPVDRKRQAVTARNSRSAMTKYYVVSRFDKYTLLRCVLVSGRTHQIRVHMAHIGHPVIGDTVYGRKKPDMGLAGQCLHARKLSFTHPSSHQLIELCAELPEYFLGVLEKLKVRT